MDRPVLRSWGPIGSHVRHRLRDLLVRSKGRRGTWGGLGILAGVDAAHRTRLGAQRLFGMAVSAHVPAGGLAVGATALWRGTYPVFSDRPAGLWRRADAHLSRYRPWVSVAAAGVPGCCHCHRAWSKLPVHDGCCRRGAGTARSRGGACGGMHRRAGDQAAIRHPVSAGAHLRQALEGVWRLGALHGRFRWRQRRGARAGRMARVCSVSAAIRHAGGGARRQHDVAGDANRFRAGPQHRPLCQRRLPVARPRRRTGDSCDGVPLGAARQIRATGGLVRPRHAAAATLRHVL